MLAKPTISIPSGAEVLLITGRDLSFKFINYLECIECGPRVKPLNRIAGSTNRESYPRMTGGTGTSSAITPVFRTG